MCIEESVKLPEIDVTHTNVSFASVRLHGLSSPVTFGHKTGNLTAQNSSTNLNAIQKQSIK